MKEKEMAERNKILIIRSGSHLYGLNTPESDVDYIGIFIPDEEYYFGSKTCEQVDLSYVDKLESGKNSKAAVDCTFYSIQKFFKLAQANNPNILEVLFVNEENIVFCNNYGRELLALKNAFLAPRIEDTFFGYAKSQERKILTKKETYERLIAAKEFLKPYENNYLLEIKAQTKEQFEQHFKDKDKFLLCLGDLNLNKNITAKRACSVIVDRLGKCGNRVELIKERAYDTKFASHIIRLFAELKQVALEKTLSFPLKYERELVLQIKKGEVDLQTTLKHIERLKEECRELQPELQKLNQNTKLIEEKLIELTKSFLKGT